MDPIADFINRLKGASRAGKAEVVVPYSGLKHAIAKRLITRGYISEAKQRGGKVQKDLVVTLKYRNGAPVIHDAQRVSKPSRRLYKRAEELFAPRHGSGALILSTSKGILDEQEARKAHVGGEALFIIH